MGDASALEDTLMGDVCVSADTVHNRTFETVIDETLDFNVEDELELEQELERELQLALQTEGMDRI